MMEFDFNRDVHAPIPDATRLALGVHLADNYITQLPNHQEEASQWLKSIGFQGIEWVVNGDGDILFLLLWRMDMAEHFILAFTGFDDLTVTLWTTAGAKVVM